MMKRTRRVLYVGLLGLALMACKKGSGDKCTFNKDCKDTLVCMAAKSPSSCMEYDKAKAMCQASELCKVAGRCGAGPVTADYVANCTPKSDEDCKQSSNCTKSGNCTYDSKSGNCI